MSFVRFAALLAVASLAQAQGLSGSWAGAVQLPGQELPIQVTLLEGLPWTGRISIPAQGLSDFPLAAVTGTATGVSFGMKVPGDPFFQARLGMDGRLSGTLAQAGQTFPFHLARVQGAPPLAAPAALPAGLQERPVEVGQTPWVLPGTLTLPAGAGPFPAVVLVHGSGPQDRNERIGACEPFRDLAWGLAQRGIAVLRYDKRTFVYRAGSLAVPSFTVHEETLEDAGQAVTRLKALAGIDGRRIFLLGHSLGGYLLPRLAKRAPGCAGYISLAGSARPMEDLILEQLRGQGAPAEVLAQVQAEVARIKALDPRKPVAGAILNGPASYWLDLQGYQPAREAAAIAAPMFFLQGDADCQVPLRDFEVWRQGLAGQSRVRWQRYPHLNHLFMPVTGISTGAEYAQPGQHVDPAVLQDLAAWIGSVPALARP